MDKALTGYIYVIATLVAFSVLGVSYKIGERKKCNIQQMNFFLFFSAAIVIGIWMIIAQKPFAAPKVLGIGTGMAAMAVGSMTAFRFSVGKGPMATTWTVTNLSFVIPMLVSILFFGETPTLQHYVGFVLISLSIIFMGFDVARSGK